MADQDRKKRLGKGLAALIGETDLQETEEIQRDSRADRFVSIDQVTPGKTNPRRDFDADNLGELAHSIGRHGMMQPILVRPVANGRAGPEYEIIAGERRWRAAQLAKLHEVPVIIRNASDREMLELAIIENIQRTDLNALEEAAGYRQLQEEHGYSQAELAQTLGKSRSHIANTTRLLNLPQGVRELIMAGKLSAGHARTLLTAEDPVALARRIIEGGLSVRQAEALQRKPNGAKGHSGGNASARDPNIRALERQFEEKLGLKVSVSHRANGTGSVRIAYGDVDQLEGLVRRIQAAR